MIDIKNLDYHYAGSHHKVYSDFSLSIAEPGIYGLLGKNGTGKSTLLYLMNGLLIPDKGTIQIDGQRPQDRRPEFLREIFLVPEEFDLPDVSLKSYIRMNRPFYPHFSEEILQKCLTEFELTPDLKIGRLSMGQKKKVFISFSLAAQTRYLLMDEPTNGLDIPSKSQFRKIVVSNMSPEATVIISTHQVREVDQMLEHITIIDQNQVKLHLSVEEICRQYCFELHSQQDKADFIYAEPSLMGNAVITKNTDGRETALNVELLFNAIVSGALKPESI